VPLRALFVTAHCPSPNAKQAGHKVSFHFLSELAQTHEVELVVLIKSADFGSAEKEIVHLRSVAKSVTLIQISALERALSWLPGLFMGLAPRFCTRISFSARAKMRRILADGCGYDLVWLDFSQSAWIVRLLAPKTNVMLSLHDIQVMLVSSKSALERVLMLGFTFQSERKILTSARLVRVLSNTDKWLLHSLFRFPLARVEVVEPSLSSFLEGVRRNKVGIEPHSLLFWGAMARKENSYSAIDFITKRFPALKSKYPDAKIYVVGSDPPDALSALSSDAVVVTGFVDDPTIYFEKAALGVAPLTTGAGIKIKVLEMLYAGIPVVSTPIGAEGVRDNPSLTVVDLDAFVGTIDAIWARG
jgi:hypothetical protein